MVIQHLIISLGMIMSGVIGWYAVGWACDRQDYRRETRKDAKVFDGLSAVCIANKLLDTLTPGTTTVGMGDVFTSLHTYGQVNEIECMADQLKIEQASIEQEIQERMARDIEEQRRLWGGGKVMVTDAVERMIVGGGAMLCVAAMLHFVH